MSSTTGFNELISDPQLDRYARLIYDITGIRISPQKKTLLSNRLRRRLRETGLADYEAYYHHLKKLPAGHAEWDAFLQEITTHETYLFRDETQWAWFRQVFLPDFAGQAAGKRPLRIWSAACSTGDEPFTIACCAAAAFPAAARSRVKILATDIGVGALAQARRGQFSERAMRLVPADLKKAWFRACDDGTWQAQPTLGQLIEFRQHNLLEPLREPPFDLVVLKNVLIYFDAESKKRVLENLRRVLRPGGLLLAGGSEGVADLLREYERVQPWLFRVPSAQTAAVPPR